jgi:gas vesicle protein
MQMNNDTTASAIGETIAHQAADLTAPLTDAADTVSRTAAENIGLTLIGGLAVGLVVGALLPLARRRKSPKKTVRALAATLAATVSELSQTLAAQTRDRAETAARDGRDTLDHASRTIGKSIHEQSGAIRAQASKLADGATDQLNDTSKAIARKVVKWVEKARR